MTEPIDPQARALIESFEGYHDALPDGRCKPYRCPAKIPTLGFGATYYESGRKVQMSDPPITRARASELLSNQLVIYAAAVDKGVKTPIHPLMRGACISLAFNIGTSAFGKSTALRLINQRRWSEVPAAFARYRIGGGRVLAGLERRRKAEGALFMAGVRLLQTGGGTVTPLVADTPAAPAPAKASIFGRFLSLFQRAA